MKKIFGLVISGLVISSLLMAQTLNVQVGNITYQFPSAEAGVMTYTDGTTLTIMNKVFSLNEVNQMYVDETEVTNSTVSVAYNGTNASLTVAGNIAQYLTISQSGAHISITQSSSLAEEITYTLSGTTTDGEFYMEGSYKATVELNGLTLTNANPVYSGAAVHIQNGKCIKVKPLTGTTSTLIDASTGSQKGCLYVKGHIEFAQNGALNITGNVKHGIKAGEYISIKNSSINVLSSVGDGINCEQFFLMESGAISLTNVGDDGLQCDIEDTTTGSTGQTTNHKEEDSGNIYIQGGTITANITTAAAKGIKAEGDICVTDGIVTITTSGKGTWDTDDLETKASACISSDANISVSGGTLNLTSTGSGGKGMKCDNLLTITGGDITIKTTGGLYYNNGSTENTNYTGNTDNINSNYYSSPKGIKAGTKTESGSGWNVTYTYAGGIVISGGTVNVSTSGTNGEGIESKSTMDINGGEIIVNAYDDALNAASHLTINDGMVYARATNNDGIDANGNVYIKGGLVYAIGASGAEKGIDANTEGGYKLYVQGGTIVAIGGLENGASLTQTCYNVGAGSNGWQRFAPQPGPGGQGGGSSSWTANTWYAMTYGSTTFAFKTPSSGGTSMIISASSTPTMKSGITVSSGTAVFDGVAYTDATYTGGSTVTVSSYSSSGGGGFGW